MVCVEKGQLLVSRPEGVHRIKHPRRIGGWKTYGIGVFEDAWKGMSEITPWRYEHATGRRREARVADDLEEC